MHSKMNLSRPKEVETVEIIPFAAQYREYFNSLNRRWIEKFFVVEEIDKKVLENPEEFILKPGGKIIFARYKGEIVGTCALLKINEQRYEMTKMAVDPKAQGKQIGKKLALAIIEEARALGTKILFLESNSSLSTAIRLYERIGFEHSPRWEGLKPAYQRADVYMEIKLN